MIKERQLLLLKKGFIVVLFCFFVFFLIFQVVKADSISTIQSFTADFSAGDVLRVQDLSQSGAVNFSVQVGSLHGLTILTLTDTGGSLSVTPTAIGSVVIYNSFGRFYPYFNDVALTEPTPSIAYGVGVPFTVSWSYSQSIPPPWQVASVRSSLYSGLTLWAVVSVVVAAATVLSVIVMIKGGMFNAESINQIVLAISLIIVVDIAIVVAVAIINGL